MISGTGRQAGTQGFTLLELITTLAVIGLFTGLVVYNFASEDREEQLSRVSTALQKAALLAKYQAHSTRRDHYLLLDAKGFAVSDAIPRDDTVLLSRVGDSEFGSPHAPLIEEQFPAGLRCQNRRHETEAWQTPRGEPWVFRSSGLNDPMEIRISIENDFAVLQFEVLTGRAESYLMIE